MSIRITVLTLVVLFLAGYAWKNWFNALIGTIVLFAFLEHPDMPNKVAGVPGLNLLNLLIFNVAFAWISQRQAEADPLDFPQSVKIAFSLYIAVVVIACLRAVITPTPYFDGTRTDILIEALLNPVKYLLPALMLYDGCHSRDRVFLAIAAILSVYFLLSLQVIKAMGLHFDFSSGSELSARAARVLDKRVGYHRVDLSMMFAGASWAVIAFSRRFESYLVKFGLLGVAGVILLGQAVTGGRTGYAAWVLIGLILCTVRWKKYLPIIPVAIAAVIIFIPAVRERMFQGFSRQEGGFVSQTNASSITSGRTDIWPYVVDEVKKAPVIGYGRYAMNRTGLSIWAEDNLGEYLSHPHNAYLEALLDNGLLGFCCMMPIYFLLLRCSFQLVLNREDILYEVAGGVAIPLLLSFLIACFGAQTLYPREGVVGMWAALAIALRLTAQIQTADAEGVLYESEWKEATEEDYTAESPGHWRS